MHTIETADAGELARKVAYRARMYHLANISAIPFTVQRKATAMQMALETVINFDKIYVTARKTMLTVKVVGQRIKDRKGLKFLQAGWEQEGIKLRVTPQGMLYNIPA